MVPPASSPDVYTHVRVNASPGARREGVATTVEMDCSDDDDGADNDDAEDASQTTPSNNKARVARRVSVP